MAFTGDTSRLAGMIRTINKLARVPDEAAKIAAPDIEGLIEQEFEAGADPYHKPWKPISRYTKRRYGSQNNPPLTDSGEMRKGIEVTAVRGRGIQVSIPDPGGVHQGGRADMPARAIFPDKGPPASWNAVIKNAVEEAARK